MTLSARTKPEPDKPATDTLMVKGPLVPTPPPPALVDGTPLHAANRYASKMRQAEEKIFAADFIVYLSFTTRCSGLHGTEKLRMKGKFPAASDPGMLGERCVSCAKRSTSSSPGQRQLLVLELQHRKQRGRLVLETSVLVLIHARYSWLTN